MIGWSGNILFEKINIYVEWSEESNIVTLLILTVLIKRTNIHAMN